MGRVRSALVVVALTGCMLPCAAASADRSAEAEVAERLEGISQLVGDALARRELPGCVVEIGTHAGPVYLRAFGERTRGEPMTPDTVFDLASVTKPLATAASLALLAEQRALTLDVPVSQSLSELRDAAVGSATLQELLLHTSGLPAVLPLSAFRKGLAPVLTRIAALRLASEPGARFAYSDLGYLLLGEVVARTSGQPLARFAEERLFAPLGMRDTRFGVAHEARARVAPTEYRDGAPIRGVVDDPRAYRLGGAAGHAGVFSTASDVGRFARMLLRGGELDGTRVLAEQSVRRFLRVRPAGEVRRALGWDAESRYAHGRGTLFSARAVGHGGYTGTSVWLDPALDLYVVLLSNRVHAGARGTIHPLASSIADVAVRALRGDARDSLRVGADVLHAEAYARVRGRRVALLTHAAARDARGVGTLERLLSAPAVQVVAILTPEHGLSGRREGKVGSGRHRGVPVHSLFGERRRPTRRMLRRADVLVVDLVDIGTRFYTYMATVLATLEAAAQLELPVYLLDRPNPLGDRVEGPLAEARFASFVNYHPLPVRHGMTAGELARFLCRARGLRTRLHVVRAEGFSRAEVGRSSGSGWYAPSPNIGSVEQALLYPATGLVEGTNLSVGRGTARAFRVVGAPFLEARRLAHALREERLSGLRVRIVRFRPSVGPYARTRVPGVELHVTDAASYSSAHTGLALIRALLSQGAGWDRTRLARLVAHRETLALLERGVDPRAIIASWEPELARFRRERAEVLLYP